MCILFDNHAPIQNNLSFFEYASVELQENIAEEYDHVREFKHYPCIPILQIILVPVD